MAAHAEVACQIRITAGKVTADGEVTATTEDGVPAAAPITPVTGNASLLVESIYLRLEGVETLVAVGVAVVQLRIASRT